MARITTKLRFVTARGREAGETPFHEVEIEPDDVSGEPLPLVFVFRFAELEHDDGARGLACVEFEVTQREKPSETAEVEAITRPALTDLARRWDKLEQVARMSLEAQLGEATGGEYRRAVRTRRQLSPEFLADVARRHEDFRSRGLAPTQALAREERVSVSTVKHWLRKAREAGIDGTS